MAQKPTYNIQAGPGAPPRPGRVANPPATFAIQGKVPRDEDRLSSMYLCSRCAIRYEVIKGRKASCPLCAMERTLTEANMALEQLRDENLHLKRKTEALAVQMDHVTAIREAMQLVEYEDLVFLKQVMYLYRDDRSYRLTALASNVQMTSRGRIAKKQNVRNELMLTRGGRDPQQHHFTSIGGVAIVGYFDEMTREVGEKQAMGYLLRAVSLFLSKAE